MKSAAEPALSLSSGSIGLSLPVALNSLTPAVPIQGPAMAAAAAMQLGGMPPLQSQPTKKSTASPVGHTKQDSKAEIRRARRCDSAPHLQVTVTPSLESQTGVLKSTGAWLQDAV